MTCVSSWQDDLHSQLGTEHVASVRLQIWKHTLSSAMLCSPKNMVHILRRKQNLSVFYTACLEQHTILWSFTKKNGLLQRLSWTTHHLLCCLMYQCEHIHTNKCTHASLCTGMWVNFSCCQTKIGQKKKRKKNWSRKMRQGSGERWATGDRKPTGWQRCFGSHFPLQLHRTQDLLLQRQQLRLGNNSALNISSNSEVNQPSECLRTHLGEGGKLVESFDEAEELQWDAGGDDQQAHGEQDQAAQLLGRPKYLSSQC